MAEKFQFDTDFQENLLQYTVTDQNGYRALQLYEDTYFTLLEHQIIAKCLKGYFKKKVRIPQAKSILREELRKMFMGKEFINALSTEDKNNINKIVTRLYANPVKDGDEILDSTVKFARYIKLKDTIERINLTDFNQYEAFSSQVVKSINIGSEFKEDKGVFLIKDIKDRQFKRRFNDNIIPTPFWQINKLTNAGGFEKGSVIVLIGPEKEFKTGMLVNIARSYMRHRKKILVVDLENGQDSWTMRLEQSIMSKTKLEIRSGDYDSKIQKQFRKYQRLGGEVVVKRFPAGSTANDVQTYMDVLYRDEGIKFDTLIVDYAALMGALSGNKDETQKISDVYVDLKNLANYNKLDTLWTANHIVRTADKRFESKFLSGDTAKCIDIVRHVDAAFGFNRSKLDQEGNTARLEIIDQRDGVQNGYALFRIDYARQKAYEVSKQDLKDYHEVKKQLEAGMGTVRVKSDLD